MNPIPLVKPIWHLCITVRALADAGSSLDRASLARTAAALRYIRHPDVEVGTARKVIVHTPVPLALHHAPFCIFFAFYCATSESSGATRSGAGGLTVTTAGAAPRVLPDPAGLKRRLTQRTLNLALTPQREHAVVQKACDLPLVPEVLMGAVLVADRRAEELDAWLDVRVREDWMQKKVEVC